jgi:glutamate racemase
MKIGIFDSGLGGLVIAKSILKRLPKYDYIYLGDTKNLPYGEKTPTQIYRYTKNAVDFMFKQNCQLVIVACNTSSALALRRLQQKYLPKNYPNRRILGVVVPTLEVAYNKHRRKKIGVIGTSATINSHIYKKELSKIDKKAKIFELATPKLVPLIEKNSLQNAAKTLKLYLKTLGVAVASIT